MENEVIIEELERLKKALVAIEKGVITQDLQHLPEHTRGMDNFNMLVGLLCQNLGFNVIYHSSAQLLLDSGVGVRLTRCSSHAIRTWNMTGEILGSNQSLQDSKFILKTRTIKGLVTFINKLVENAKKYQQFEVECSYTVVCQVVQYAKSKSDAEILARKNTKDDITICLSENQSLSDVSVIDNDKLNRIVLI